MNNVDDDGNGLVDMKDYYCYFGSTSPDTCIPTKIVWATLKYKLYWVDLETNADKSVSFPIGEGYDDITWASDGKLYGAESNTGEIREIDPLTAQTQFRWNVQGHYATNAMVADASGNLILASYTTSHIWNIVRLNMTTGQSTIILSLTSYNLESAGDLAFLDGYLYVACANQKLAKINLGTGALQTFNTTGNTGNGFGLITLGDGFLYISGTEKIYKLDPNTMNGTDFYTLPSYGFIFGLSCYSDFCQAPRCKAKVNIGVQSSTPYCSNTGVSLKANGSGINGPSGYSWILPDGSTRNTDTLTAFISGKYFARYHTVPDTCSAVDSILLTITKFPAASLGNDTSICPGSQLILQPVNTQDVISYKWQDGSTSTQFVVAAPGIYWLETSNACGTFRDSVSVSGASIPQVDIGIDTLLCPGSSITLTNKLPRQPQDVYLWSTSQTSSTITVNQPGNYWLESRNACGVIRDSIKITGKDSCICRPFYPAVKLGIDQSICKGETLTIHNEQHQGDFRYTWQNGNHDSVFYVQQPGLYWVNVSTYCGQAADTVVITEKTSGCICNIYMPSAFTPNYDNRNDTYKPLSGCSISGKMRIYNRWSQLVYSTDNLQKGWDGYYQGMQQNSDVYIYYISYQFARLPGIYSKKGSFLLLK